MANTLLTAGGIFPDGTVVDAYELADAQSFAGRHEAPAGISSVETQTIASGEATFTTLAKDHPYLVYAKAGAVASTVDVTTPGDGSHDQVEVVTLRGFDGQAISGGTWALTVDVAGGSGAATTADLPYDASAVEVQVALEALADVAPGDVVVTGSRGGPYTLSWGGTLADTAITTTVDANGLTGATKHQYVGLSGS